MSNTQKDKTNKVKHVKTRDFYTTWYQTLRKLLPGAQPLPLSDAQYKQSLVLVLDSSTDYIPFSEILTTHRDDMYQGGLTTMLPFFIWVYVFAFVEASLWKKIVSVMIFALLTAASAQAVLSGYVDTILGGDMERPFTYLSPTVVGIPGVGVQKFDHKDFLALQSSPTIMYLTQNNWITSIKGSTGFLVPAEDFFKAAREAKIEARNLSELTSNFLSNDAIATAQVRSTAGTSVNDQFEERSMILSRMGFYMAYSIIVWITFSDPNLEKVTGFLVRNLLAILTSLAVIIFDIIKITPAAINKTLIVKRNLMFLAYSLCILALL
tara:strand:- start:3187 stop:4155 length:969 start_codon:yes stop_codon:yes gene_type:complete